MDTLKNKTLCERALRCRGRGINCEWGGIVKIIFFRILYRTNTLTFLL